MTRPKRHLCIIGDSDTISKYVQALVHCSYPARRTRGDPKTWAAGKSPSFARIHNPRMLRHGNKPRVDAAWSEHGSHSTLTSSRGSKFLKSWMEFLEENADLRYPNLADVYVDEQDG